MATIDTQAEIQALESDARQEVTDLLDALRDVGVEERTLFEVVMPRVARLRQRERQLGIRQAVRAAASVTVVF